MKRKSSIKLTGDVANEFVKQAMAQSPAERSGGLQACPTSAGGCADATAVTSQRTNDDPPVEATSSVRCAEASGPAAVDTEHRDCPVCPTCGFEDYDGANYSEDSVDQVCPSCGQTYHADRHVTITYNTSKLPDAHPAAGERARRRNEKADRSGGQ